MKENRLVKLIAFVFATLLLLAFPFAASAKEEEDPEFMKRLFAPELILENASAIGLSKEQQRAMIKELKETQLRATGAEFDVYEAALALNELSEAKEIDEAAMLAAARQVFDAERLIKEAHLTLLIRMRNALTESQRRKLVQIRDGEN